MTVSRREPLSILLVQARPDGVHEGGQGTAPPLGLLSIAAYARAALPAEVSFRLVDGYFLSDQEILAEARRSRPQLVAMSGLTTAHDRIRRLVRLLGDLQGVPILLGGPHATAYPEVCLDHPGTSGVIPGEGEIPFTDFVEHLLGRRPVDQVRGLLRRVRGGTVRGPTAPQLMDLDALPAPALDLIDPEAYAAVPNDLATIVLPPHRYLPLFTSRGCPFGCTFCHDIFGRRFRGQSPTRVLDHVERLLERYGVRDFHLYDDLFNGRKGRLLAFAQEAMRRNLGVRFWFSNGLRADILDREQLEAMAHAGVVYFGAAIESASPRMQRITNKRMDVLRLLENVAIADEVGIFTTGFLMLGVPGETREEMELTIRTAAASALHYAYFSVLNPYSGTAIGRAVAEAGADVSPERMPGGYSSSGANAAGIPPEEFRTILRQAYRRFWTPRRIVAFAARHPDPGGLAAALATPRTARNMIRRVASVLGAEEPVGAGVSWTLPAPLPAAVVTLFRRLGTAGALGAGLLHRPAPGIDEGLRKLLTP
ncbi:MAG: radical SAM protein [Pseudomonadota bacterium]